MLDELPTGTVTFLFTDVEGSTALLERLGAGDYAVELVRHREIVREALVTHGGIEVDTQGDAFFCAFSSARAAVACAAEIRDRLAATPVRVRIGLHTGEALVVGRHYVGMDVHRAARIGACGHGGQVVLSPSTVALLEPGAFKLCDLGPHRLKDLAAPVALHQLGDERFPPLKALFRTNLPVPATPFLGRGADLAELLERTAEPSVRLLTLTGPGGTGKTRLALQVAAELSDAYPDGTWWVPLAPLRDSALVASAVAGVLGVEEQSGLEVADSIARAVTHKRLLLLLDNCEHLVDSAASLVGRLVLACPGLFVLATSREPLQLTGENLFPVSPLARHDAVALFHARARAAGATFEGAGVERVVEELCARLDDLPLAVELAAARSVALPPATLLERLSTTLDLLRGPRDADERQRTLRATIAWSYDLLEDEERRVFRAFAVFVGGASLPAIEAVCNATLDEVLSLVSRSLLRQLSGDGDVPRYFMLETIREFAAAELANARELESIREGHVEWYAELARTIGAEEALANSEHLPQLEPDVPNLRAAFEYSLGREGDSLASTQLAAALLVQHLARGRYAEALTVARSALDLGIEPDVAALFHSLLGVALRILGRPDEALASYRDAERLLESMPAHDASRWNRWLGVKLNEGHFFYMQNQVPELERVIAELELPMSERGTPVQQRDFMHLRQQHRYRLERYALSEEAERVARTIHALDLAEESPSADFLLGFCLLWRGKPTEAEIHFERGLDVARSAGVAVIEARCLVYSLIARRKLDDPTAARARLLELEALEELHGYHGLVRANAAWLSLRSDDLDAARRDGRAALADWRAEGRTGHGVFEWTARFPLLGVAVARDELDEAHEHGRAMLDESQQPLPDELAAAVERAVRSGEPEDYRSALELARPLGYA